jgi:malonate-semialdehyde dehydrogenase (acetylating)/methylmalonate-semialdehyde dehydrogenase
VVPLIINGQKVQSKATSFSDIWDPATGEVIARAPHTTAQEMEDATASAQDAYAKWRLTPPPVRMRVMLKYQALIRQHTDELADMITREQGKTTADAKGDIFRGLEVVEHACTVPSLLMGESLPHLSEGLDTHSYRLPLGVCGGITPFNFPAMCPLWMFPLACTAGNTFVLKPSERVPMTAIRLAELAMEAGLPNGVLNLIHGTADAVNHLCDDPRIKAVSFVGGEGAGMHIYQRCASNGKRSQCNMAAKNHAIIMPDADPVSVANQLAGASCGAAGQRCMAISVAVFVGHAKEMIPRVVEMAKTLKVGPGSEAVDVGPLITAAARDKVHRLIGEGVRDGATLLLDGRGDKPADAKYANGFWCGPTILSDVTPGMACYDEEIFGPVLSCVNVDSLDDAISFINNHPCGNGAAVFTRSGAAARKAVFGLDAGQVGVNVPIPVPLPMFSFTGNKRSIAGDLNFYGKMGLQFYTQTKTVTSNWKSDAHTEALSTSMPTMK